MSANIHIDDLAAELDDALSLLTEYRTRDNALMPAEPLPSLLEECRTLCAEFTGPEPVRSLHHFACTGGTLVSKCIAALPNVVLLSEIDPLSRLGAPSPRQQPHFAPTNLFLPLLQSLHGIDERVVVEAFQAAIKATCAGLARHGQQLVLRDHAHSQFCTDVDPDSRPSLYDMLHDSHPVHALVTVRHPLDSFISLDKNGWRHFQPFTLQEYSRRYMGFLDRHEGLPLLKYEDFVGDPTAGLQKICTILQLPFHGLAFDLIPAIALSGDSGRSDAVIAPRPRQAVPEAIAEQRGATDYLLLCRRLDYDP